MVLNMLDYCRNNAIVHIGYSHPFVITELSGINHIRIVITNVVVYGTDYQRNIIIEYDVNLEDRGNVLNVTRHSLEITEHEYNELIEMNSL